MTKHAMLVSCLCLAASVASADNDKKYTMTDLKALVDQKSFQEALMHLGDIAPSARNAEWQDVAVRAALGMVDSGEDAVTKLTYMIAIEKQYPVLIKNAKYAAMRTDLGPKGFDACFQGGDTQTCLDYALKFIDADPGNGKLALAIAKVGRRGMNSYSAVPLFKRAVASNKAAVCKDDDLSITIVAALGLPADYTNQVDARSIASTACWAELRKPIVDELAKGETGYFHDNACALLKDKHDRDAARLCTK
ncbi:MAG TPA: hypothetical protein VLX92_28535 [Kofleriaceae bacterium]|nr:hypothetical protein [Kofleriaceae bacterium]